MLFVLLVLLLLLLSTSIIICLVELSPCIVIKLLIIFHWFSVSLTCTTHICVVCELFVCACMCCMMLCVYWCVCESIMSTQHAYTTTQYNTQASAKHKHSMQTLDIHTQYTPHTTLHSCIHTHTHNHTRTTTQQHNTRTYPSFQYLPLSF